MDDFMAKKARPSQISAGRIAGLNNVLELAVDLGTQLRKLGIAFCVIGGTAYQRWGEPRQTTDVDATLLVEFGRELEVVRNLLKTYSSRIENAESFALQNRIVLLQSENGIGIDLSLGGLPYESRLIERSSLWKVPRHGEIRTCSAEDLVVLKSFASRPQDWIDVEKVIIRQGPRLDRALIVEEIKPLAELKEEPEILSRLDQLFSKHPA
jgi:hypothetical protein